MPPVTTIDELLADARARLDRVTPSLAAARLHDGDHVLLVDLRLAEQRQLDGEIPGATVIALNHLEWRVDPTSSTRIDAARDHDVEIILLCDEGYCSSLAAARLHDLGLRRATDVIGGFRAWRAAGLPVET